jgi:hypothetical protein
MGPRTQRRSVLAPAGDDGPVSAATRARAIAASSHPRPDPSGAAEVRATSVDGEDDFVMRAGPSGPKMRSHCHAIVLRPVASWLLFGLPILRSSPAPADPSGDARDTAFTGRAHPPVHARGEGWSPGQLSRHRGRDGADRLRAPEQHVRASPQQLALEAPGRSSGAALHRDGQWPRLPIRARSSSHLTDVG